MGQGVSRGRRWVYAMALVVAGLGLAGDEPTGVTPDEGKLVLALSGNRRFCVDSNEVRIKPGPVRSGRQTRSTIITTFGYKYQITASRGEGNNSVVKLFESPAVRTAYLKEDRQKPEPPRRRPLTPEEMREPKQPFGRGKSAHWIQGTNCTYLPETFNFPLAPGRYDLYLGFDVLLQSGQWVPLQSDYVTDVRLEKGQITRVHGTVDYSAKSRIVRLDSAENPKSAGSR